MLILKHNEVVGQYDRVVHAGDFTFNDKEYAARIIKRLNGIHTFLRGNHDRWLHRNHPTQWSKTFDKQHLVVCHYAMRVWNRSHFNSWQLYGHSHGRLPPEGKQWDVGVDNNNYYPVSFEQVKKIMAGRPDNFNYVYRPDFKNWVLGEK